MLLSVCKDHECHSGTTCLSQHDPLASRISNTLLSLDDCDEAAFSLRFADGNLVWFQPGIQKLSPPDTQCIYFEHGYALHGDLTDFLADLLCKPGDLAHPEKVDRELGRFALNLAAQYQLKISGVGPRVATIVSRKKEVCHAVAAARGKCQISFPIYKRLQDSAVEQGLVRMVPGNWAKGTRTLMMLTPEFAEVFEALLPTVSVQRLSVAGKVVMKNESKLPVRYARTAETVRWEQELDGINRVNAQHLVCEPEQQGLVPMGEADVQFDRVFNNRSWSEGGRCYAPFQNRKGAERLQFSIDGQPVAELDYSAMHIRMLYHLAGQPCIEDPYESIQVFGFNTPDQMRKAVKLATNVALNCRSASGAHSAVVNRFDELAKVAKAQNKAPPLPIPVDPHDLVKSLFEAHPIVKESLGKETGLRLQRRDSEIAVAVMLRMTSQGLPCLGVHDSFVVRQEDAGLLAQAMVEEYEVRFGYEPAIKLEGGLTAL